MTRKRLTRAGEEQRLVRVRRRKPWPRYDGYPVALSDDWLALRVVSEEHAHGLVLVRTRDVRKVGKPDVRPRVARGVLEQHGQWPPSAPELLDLWDTRTVLFTAGSLAPELTVACEKLGTQVTGGVYRITDDELLLADGTAVPLKDVTRVDVR